MNKNRKSISSKILIIIIVVSSYLSSGWFRNTLKDNLFIALTFLFTTVLITFLLYKPTKLLKRLSFISFGLLLLLGFITTNFKNEYVPNPAEADLEITRMNYYPPSQARLGYILEHQKLYRFIENLQRNFFDVLDLRQYFPNYFSYLFFPLFCIGIMTVLRRNSKLIIYYLLSSIFLLIILGVHGKYGPFIIFPFFEIFIIASLIKIFRITKSEN